MKLHENKFDSIGVEEWRTDVINVSIPPRWRNIKDH
jgi:hypothetical protein